MAEQQKTATQRRATPESTGDKDAKNVPLEDRATRATILKTDSAGPAFQGSKTNDEVMELEPKILTPEAIHDAPMFEPENTVSLTGSGGTKVTAHKDDAKTHRALGFK